MQIRNNVQIIGHDYDVFSLFTHLQSRIEPKFSFLLESIESRNKPLYSFLCFDPDYILEIRNGATRISSVNTERGERILSARNSQERITQKKSTAIEDFVENRIVALDAVSGKTPSSTSTRPQLFSRQVFYGGYLGLIAYDAVGPWVGFESKAESPEVLLGMHTDVLIYDHRYETLVHVQNRPNGLKGDFPDYKKLLQDYRPQRTKFKDVAVSTEAFKGNTSQDEFSGMIESAKEHILNGDIFQVVLSRRVDRKIHSEDLKIYNALRSLNPSPYMYYINFHDRRYVGSSPEALVSLDGRKVSTVPIAGTRRRGRTVSDEKTMRHELTSDPKERAEHVMLVDLARNDLSKLAEPGTVKTSGLMTVKKFRHVMHMVTMVSCLLRTGYGPFDVLKCVFPAGTVSGAPKIRAMEIIQELEKENRGAYAGAIGYIAFNGDMDWAITIRTIELLRNHASVQAGAGIVADSQPNLEWIETENKMRSLLKAITMAELKTAA